MRKTTRILSLFLAVLLLSAVLSTGVNAADLGGSVDMGDVVQMGDFQGLSHYIVFYPKALESSDQAWPVAVWANGTMCAPVLYTNLLREIAAQGFVVVASADVMSADGKAQCAAIDYILGLAADSGSVFFGKVDGSRIAALGHSQGGRSTVNAAGMDSRIRCAVSIAGSPFSGEAKKNDKPTLFLTATGDLFVLSAMWVKPAYNNCSGPAVYASLKNGIHTSCMLKPSAYSGYVVSWLRAWLDGDAAAMNVFRPGGSFSADRAWTGFAAKGF